MTTALKAGDRVMVTIGDARVSATVVHPEDGGYVSVRTDEPIADPRGRQAGGRELRPQAWSRHEVYRDDVCPLQGE